MWQFQKHTKQYNYFSEIYDNTNEQYAMRDEELDVSLSEITKDEIEYAIRSLKKDKQAGIDKSAV